MLTPEEGTDSHGGPIQETLPQGTPMVQGGKEAAVATEKVGGAGARTGTRWPTYTDLSRGIQAAEGLFKAVQQYCEVLGFGWSVQYEESKIYEWALEGCRRTTPLVQWLEKARKEKIHAEIQAKAKGNGVVHHHLNGDNPKHRDTGGSARRRRGRRAEEGDDSGFGGNQPPELPAISA